MRLLAMIVCCVVIMDGAGGARKTVDMPEPENIAVEASKTADKPIYSIHGIIPPKEWQNALYGELKRLGIEWYYDIACCQIWQESRWNPKADNGKDKGITQQKAIYWQSRAARYGVPNASIWDVNAQFRVFAGMMSGYLKATNNDIGWALSYYFYGNGSRADKYVHDVMSHMPFLEEVK